MAKFYFHNKALTDKNVWDPNVELGDLQLVAFSSWMNHEESRVVEMKRILAREKNEPLLIKVEQSNPIALIKNHNLIANDPQLTPRYIAAQKQAISHF